MLSFASECNIFGRAQAEFESQLAVVRKLDADILIFGEQMRSYWYRSGWDGRLESIEFENGEFTHISVLEDLQPGYDSALASYAMAVSERLIEVRRLQQIDFIHAAAGAIELMALGRDSEIEGFSPEANALDLIHQALQYAEVITLPTSIDSEGRECDLSHAIRIAAIAKQSELDMDPEFARRVAAHSNFLTEHSLEIESGSLSQELQAELDQLVNSLDGHIRKARYAQWMWVLATLNDASVLFRDSNLIDSKKHKADHSKIGLNIDVWRAQGIINTYEWDVGYHWVLFNRRYDPNEYSYGEFSDWDASR